MVQLLRDAPLGSGPAWDAENRLTGVTYDPTGGGTLTTMATYRYDALGRRIEYVKYDEAGANPVTTRYYYDGQNAIEEHGLVSDAFVRLRAFVHGTQYVDERAVMRRYDPVSETCQDHYYLLEELYSVAGLAASNGMLEEAYVYDTYGHLRAYELSPYDVNRDGNVNVLDVIQVRNRQNTQNALYDVNFDGAVNVLDLIQVQNAVNTAAVEVSYSSVDNPYFFTGRTTDTLHTSSILVSTDPNYKRLQDNRNRTYDPKHGRWLQRDPMGYVDGGNLYEYVRSKPETYVDPRGTHIIVIGGWAGWGDGAWEETARQLGEIEKRWYRAKYPRPGSLEPYGDPDKFYEYWSNPIGLGVFGWGPPVEGLHKRVSSYVKYFLLNSSNRYTSEHFGTPEHCGCPEYLHIIGFSDGATTIAKWLNAGSPGLVRSEITVDKDGRVDRNIAPYGLVGLVDLVRTAVGPNKDPEASLDVSTVDFNTHVAFRTVTPASDLLTGGWAGYSIIGWSNTSRADDQVTHLEMPKDNVVRERLKAKLLESLAALEISEPCQPR